mmetsp:Transcript_22942/g.58361  ORF Transcript_22942/g.58361 Transcript_22942/m.58361 type:complete len:352 (-) Transcript_22942:509-1564(-)
MRNDPGPPEASDQQYNDGAASSSRPRDDSNLSDAPRDIKMKRIHEQRLLRTLVCFAAISISAFGLAAALIGASTLSAGWMSTSFGSQANSVSVSSLVLGIVTILISLVGCVGALKRKKPPLGCFGLLVAILLAIFAGGVSIIFEVERSLEEWERQRYRLPTTQLAEETLHNLFIEIGALYAYCTPNATSVATAVRALDEHIVPPTNVLSCRQTSSSSLSFADWVNLECLSPSRFANNATSLFDEINACRANVADAHAAGNFLAVVDPSVGDTTWLFCACGRPLKQTLEASWVSPTKIVFASLCAYCALLVCLLCAACQGAAKAKKRKKKNEMEMIILKQAAEDAGQDDDVL